jgi:hypothetical protein
MMRFFGFSLLALSSVSFASQKSLLAACEKGNATACYDLALSYHNAGKEELANRYAKIACDKNEAQGCYFYGDVMRQEKKVDDAILYFKRSCDGGFLAACEDYADLELQKGKAKKDLAPFYEKPCKAKLSDSACSKYKEATGEIKPSDIKNRVGKIEAFLFYNAKGTWSENVLAKRDKQLWNTMIGEGWARAPSTVTLVKVRVDGHEEAAPNNEVKIQIQELGKNPKVLVDEKVHARLGKMGIDYFPYLLKDTGCAPIEISAQLVAYADSKPVKETIPFECGE